MQTNGVSTPSPEDELMYSSVSIRQKDGPLFFSSVEPERKKG